MIELYTWRRPNGQKVSIMLEEVGLPYRVHAIDITKGEQFRARVSQDRAQQQDPGDRGYRQRAALDGVGRDPALSRREDRQKLWPQDFPAKWRVVEWLMWQMGGPGPFLGQVHHFVKFNPGKSPYAEERYINEAKRLWRVLDRRLEEVAYVAGDYSIADIAIWPWISRFAWQTIEFADHPHVKRWYLAIAERQAVKRGYECFRNGAPFPCHESVI